MKNEKILKVPFLKSSDNMLSYTDSWIDSQRLIEWKDNYEWTDSLRYVEYRGGRSSMSMLVESLLDGRKYNMFWKYFDECIRRSNNGVGPTFYGTWTFVKSGKNYSVKPVNITPQEIEANMKKWNVSLVEIDPELKKMFFNGEIPYVGVKGINV